MRKTSFFMTVLTVALVALTFVRCNDQVVFPKSVVSAEIVQDGDLLNGQTFDTSKFTVNVVYSDGSREPLKGIVQGVTKISNGMTVSANAGRDIHGEDYYVTGVVRAYDAIDLVVKGPETVDTTDEDSVTVDPYTLTVEARYAVKGEIKTLKLAPKADFTVGTASFVDPSVSLSADNATTAATATVTAVFDEDVKGVYEFTANYTGNYSEPVASTYEWNKTIAFSVAEGTYFQNSAFDPSIVSVYKVLEGKDETGTTVTGAYRFEKITEDDGLSVTLSDSSTTFPAADDATVTVEYTYVENGKYATATLAGKLTATGSDESGVIGTLDTDTTTITITLEADYLKGLNVTVVEGSKFYIGDPIDTASFEVYAVFASGKNAETQIGYPAGYTLSTGNVPADGKITFKYAGDDAGSWSDWADGSDSTVITVAVIDYPKTVTADLKEGQEVISGVTYTLDMFDFEVTLQSGDVYKDGKLPAGFEIVLNGDVITAGTAGRPENPGFDWTMAGKEGSLNTTNTVVPVADYPTKVAATQIKAIYYTAKYADEYFDFDITWKSGLTYDEESGLTAPIVSYTYDPDTAGANDVAETVTITWTCGSDHTDSFEISVTPGKSI